MKLFHRFFLILTIISNFEIQFIVSQNDLPITTTTKPVEPTYPTLPKMPKMNFNKIKKLKIGKNSQTKSDFDFPVNPDFDTNINLDLDLFDSKKNNLIKTKTTTISSTDTTTLSATESSAASVIETTFKLITDITTQSPTYSISDSETTEEFISKTESWTTTTAVPLITSDTIANIIKKSNQLSEKFKSKLNQMKIDLNFNEQTKLHSNLSETIAKLIKTNPVKYHKETESIDSESMTQDLDHKKIIQNISNESKEKLNTKKIKLENVIFENKSDNSITTTTTTTTTPKTTTTETKLLFTTEFPGFSGIQRPNNLLVRKFSKKSKPMLEMKHKIINLVKGPESSNETKTTTKFIANTDTFTEKPTIESTVTSPVVSVVTYQSSLNTIVRSLETSTETLKKIENKTNFEIQEKKTTEKTVSNQLMANISTQSASVTEIVVSKTTQIPNVLITERIPSKSKILFGRKASIGKSLMLTKKMKTFSTIPTTTTTRTTKPTITTTMASVLSTIYISNDNNKLTEPLFSTEYYEQNPELITLLITIPEIDIITSHEREVNFIHSTETNPIHSNYNFQNPVNKTINELMEKSNHLINTKTTETLDINNIIGKISELNTTSNTLIKDLDTKTTTELIANTDSFMAKQTSDLTITSPVVSFITDQSSLETIAQNSESQGKFENKTKFEEQYKKTIPNQLLNKNFTQKLNETEIKFSSKITQMPNMLSPEKFNSKSKITFGKKDSILKFSMPDESTTTYATTPTTFSTTSTPKPTITTTLTSTLAIIDIKHDKSESTETALTFTEYSKQNLSLLTTPEIITSHEIKIDHIISSKINPILSNLYTNQTPVDISLKETAKKSQQNTDYLNDNKSNETLYKNNTKDHRSQENNENISQSKASHENDSIVKQNYISTENGSELSRKSNSEVNHSNTELNIKQSPTPDQVVYVSSTALQSLDSIPSSIDSIQTLQTEFTSVPNINYINSNNENTVTTTPTINTIYTNTELVEDMRDSNESRDRVFVGINHRTNSKMYYINSTNEIEYEDYDDSTDNDLNKNYIIDQIHNIPIASETSVNWSANELIKFQALNNDIEYKQMIIRKAIPKPAPDINLRASLRQPSINVVEQTIDQLKSRIGETILKEKQSNPLEFETNKTQGVQNDEARKIHSNFDEIMKTIDLNKMKNQSKKELENNLDFRPIKKIKDLNISDKQWLNPKGIEDVVRHELQNISDTSLRSALKPKQNSQFIESNDNLNSKLITGKLRQFADEIESLLNNNKEIENKKTNDKIKEVFNDNPNKKLNNLRVYDFKIYDFSFNDGSHVQLK